MPVGATISDFYVRLESNPGLLGSYTFTVRKNGLDTDLTCVIAGSDASCSDTDSAHSVSFSGGDLLSIKAAPSVPPPTARAMRWSAKLAPNWSVSLYAGKPAELRSRIKSQRSTARELIDDELAITMKTFRNN
jgi:hypothetical protein